MSFLCIAQYGACKILKHPCGELLHHEFTTWFLKFWPIWFLNMVPGKLICSEIRRWKSEISVSSFVPLKEEGEKFSATHFSGNQLKTNFGQRDCKVEKRFTTFTVSTHIAGIAGGCLLGYQQMRTSINLNLCRKLCSPGRR